MSREEIEYGRYRDQLVRETHFAEVNRLKDAASVPPADHKSHSWIARSWRALRRWLG
jgi:hypothetical protein